MIDINQLPPISQLPDIETPFKVFAGPGAGKTTWLIAHIKKVLRESRKLGKTRKIACITYTNVAAEQLLKRLDCDKSRIDISTIHSFLYKNIIKPFSYLIQKDENGEDLFNIIGMEGHEEHIPHSDKIRRWMVTIEQRNGKPYHYLNAPAAKSNLIKMLSSLDYRLDQEGNVNLYFKRSYDVAVPSRNDELKIYKKKYWSDGIMHHEDVLFFSYYILKKSPRILDFVRNKYPYIFIDEFQDTTALQTWIVEKIAEANTTIGVIGDLAQSIYKFAGAVRTDFVNLNINGICSFKLERNYRSTQAIINFLNNLRPDIEQQGHIDTISGNSVTVLVGVHNITYDWLLGNISQDTIAIAKDNSDVENIQAHASMMGNNLLTELYKEDSTSNRAKFVHSIMIGYKWYQKKNLKEAIKAIARSLKASNPKVSNYSIQKASIYLIEDLKKDETRQKTCYDYYIQICSLLKNIYKLKSYPILTGGAPKKFYEGSTIDQVLPFVKVDTQKEDKVRTIHSTKGAEFDHVFVCFSNVEDFERFVFDAKKRLIADSDDARIYYVGFSRAKQNLYIGIPNCSALLSKRIKDLGLELIFF